MMMTVLLGCPKRQRVVFDAKETRELGVSNKFCDRREENIPCFDFASGESLLDLFIQSEIHRFQSLLQVWYS